VKVHSYKNVTIKADCLDETAKQFGVTSVEEKEQLEIFAGNSKYNM
jgi:hypothetical protein